MLYCTIKQLALSAAYHFVSILIHRDMTERDKRDREGRDRQRGEKREKREGSEREQESCKALITTKSAASKSPFIPRAL